MKDGYIEMKLFVDSPDIGSEELSRMICSQATGGWNKGDPNAGGRPYLENSWETRFGPFPDHEMDKHLGELMAFLASHGPAIRDLVSNKNCRSFLSIVFRKAGHPLGIAMDASLLKTLGECGIGLDMNVYDL